MKNFKTNHKDYCFAKLNGPCCGIKEAGLNFPRVFKTTVSHLIAFTLTWVKTIKNTIPTVVEFDPLFLIRGKVQVFTITFSLLSL